MNAGVRLKLFVISLTLVVGVGLVSGIYLEQQLRIWLAARLEAELLGQARTARELVELSQGVLSDELADELADRLGRSTTARITIVEQAGVVLGDSGLTLSELRQVENHRDRPEVREALAHGQGAAQRYSTMLVGRPIETQRVCRQEPRRQGAQRLTLGHCCLPALRPRACAVGKLRPAP